MPLARTHVVDWLGLDKETGHISLTLVDELDWSNEQGHLLLLEEKLNSYLAFIESGEVFERLVEEFDRRVPAETPINVEIIAKFDLTARSRAFMEYATQVFRDAGFSLSHKVDRNPRSN